MATHAVREIPVPAEDIESIRRRVSTRPRKLRWALSALGLDEWTNRPIRDLRLTVRHRAGFEIDRPTALRLVQHGAVEILGTRLRLRALPTPTEALQNGLLFAEEGVGWPDTEHAPRISRASWDRAKAGSTHDLAAVRRVVADLSMELSEPDAVLLVDWGAVAVRASWSRMKAYIVYAHDGGEHVFFTVVSAPPLESPTG